MRIVSLSEVAQHGPESEQPWVVVDGEVFDVSRFAEHHPGGKQILLSSSGKDASDAFNLVQPRCLPQALAASLLLLSLLPELLFHPLSSCYLLFAASSATSSAASTQCPPVLLLSTVHPVPQISHKDSVQYHHSGVLLKYRQKLKIGELVEGRKHQLPVPFAQPLHFGTQYTSPYYKETQ